MACIYSDCGAEIHTDDGRDFEVFDTETGVTVNLVAPFRGDGDHTAVMLAEAKDCAAHYEDGYTVAYLLVQRLRD